jgi:DNA-binding LacI/PurR family transcriptional regulator
MGRRGIELLLAQLDGPQRVLIQECLQASLVVRTSTGPPVIEG